MNFMLDENFPRQAGDMLEGLGHNVFDIRGTEYEGCNDTAIFRLAQKKEAIFLTTGRDFFHTVPFLFKNITV